MDPKIIGPFDSQFTLLAAQTLAANTNGPAFDLAMGGLLQASSFSPGGGGMPLQVAIFITSYKASATDETYALKIQTSPDGSTWTDSSRIATLGAGTPTDTLQNGASGGGAVLIGLAVAARYMRLVLTVGGTAPSIVLGNAYIQPMTNHLS